MIFNTYFTSLISNWSSSKCEKFQIPYREPTDPHVIRRISTDGNTLVFGDFNGVIDIWRVKSGGKCIPKQIQSITVPNHTISKVFTNTDYLVAIVDSSYILVYGLEKENFKYSLLGCFYATIPTTSVRENDPGSRFIYKSAYEPLTSFIERRAACLVVHTFGIFNNNLYLRTRIDSVSLWDLKNFNYCGEINFFNHDCAITANGDHLYIHYGTKILAYDNTCQNKKEYNVCGVDSEGDNRYITSLHFNDNLITALSAYYRDLHEVSRKLVIWNKNTCKQVSEKVLQMYEYAFLHPKLDIVYIIRQSRCKYVIKAWDPHRGEMLWVALHNSHLDSYHFSTVGCRFTLFFTILHQNYYIFDSKNGKKKPLQLNGADSSIIHFCNDSFMLTETRSQKTFTIFSFVR